MYLFSISVLWLGQIISGLKILLLDLKIFLKNGQARMSRSDDVDNALGQGKEHVVRLSNLVA